MGPTTARRRRLDEARIRKIVRIGLWPAMLTASAAVVTWGLGAENASNDALALAVRDAPVEMIVGGAIALPSKTAQRQYDWKSEAQEEDEAADESARTAGTESMQTKRDSIVDSDPDISGGTPVFRGTRVPVRSLFDYLEGGETLDEFLEQFPSASSEQARAALRLGRDCICGSL